MDYARNYERFSIGQANVFERWFIKLLTRKAQAIGQKSHKIWTLKYLLDTHLPDRTGLRVLDCGAWNGWFLSYDVPAIARKVALDIDGHFAPEIRAGGADFVLADIDNGGIPIADDSIDLVALMSVLEHLSSPTKTAAELWRILRPRGITSVIVPDVLKYKFHFWDDVTHKQPFNANSLRMLFESHGFETLELTPFNHNLFIAGNLFPPSIHKLLTRLGGRLLLYVGRKPTP